jgi:hypothetical protein
MPTTIAAVSADASTRAQRGNVLATMKNLDLIAVSGFVAIGLLVTIGLTVFLPLSEDLAAHFSLVS